jgi:hypothetical protein
MRATGKTRRGATAFLGTAALAILTGACGDEDDFENQPRRPVPIELTGVIQPDKVTVSPSKVSAGPILITVSNQTDARHSVTLEGEAVKERVGPVPPLGTATILRTVEPGSYEVTAGSERAVRREIRPAKLEVGRERRSSSGELLLP